MTTDFFVWKIDIQRRKWFVLGEESILTNMSEVLLKHIKFQALSFSADVWPMGHQFFAIHMHYSTSQEFQKFKTKILFDQIAYVYEV